jgi:hypothetical protein
MKRKSLNRMARRATIPCATLAKLRKDPRMTWTTPTFVELNMSAEIGSYSDDFDGI